MPGRRRFVKPIPTTLSSRRKRGLPTTEWQFGPIRSKHGTERGNATFSGFTASRRVILTVCLLAKTGFVQCADRPNMQ